MRTRITVVTILAACWLVSAAASSDQATPMQERVAALKASIAKNQAALKQYSWIETTQVSLKGEVKKTEEKQCYYDVNGKVVKTPIGETAPPADPRGLKGRIIEHKVDEMKDYMAKVVAVVHEYVPPSVEKIKAAEAAGGVSIQPQPTGPTLTVISYAKPGDSIAIGFDAGGKMIETYQVTSYVDKPTDDNLSLNVTFASLPDSTRYPQKSVLNVPSKSIVVTVTNSGYRKTAS